MTAACCARHPTLHEPLQAELHTAGSSSSEDDEDESEDDVELFSDEDVPASKVRELVTQEEAQQKSKKRRKQ